MTWRHFILSALKNCLKSFWAMDLVSARTIVQTWPEFLLHCPSPLLKHIAVSRRPLGRRRRTGWTCTYQRTRCTCTQYFVRMYVQWKICTKIRTYTQICRHIDATYSTEHTTVVHACVDTLLLYLGTLYACKDVGTHACTHTRTHTCTHSVHRMIEGTHIDNYAMIMIFCVQRMINCMTLLYLTFLTQLCVKLNLHKHTEYSKPVPSIRSKQSTQQLVDKERTLLTIIIAHVVIVSAWRKICKVCSVHEQEGIATPALLVYSSIWSWRGSEKERGLVAPNVHNSNHACNMNSHRFIMIARLSVATCGQCT